MLRVRLFKWVGGVWMKHLPRVMQKNGNIEVLGKGKPLIYIDNKKTKGTVDLDSIGT